MGGRKPEDVVFIYGKSNDGKSCDVLRQRGEGVEAGRLRPLEEGKPIHGEVLQLKSREDSPLLFDAEVQHGARESTGRPAKVANEQYRRGWDSIWAERPREHSIN